MSRPIEFDSGLIEPLRHAGRIVELIFKLTNVPQAEIRRRLQAEYADLGSNVREALRAENIEPGVWSQRLEQFYETTDAFLYETVIWNLTHAKCDLRVWIGNYLQRVEAPKNILLFGDGLGFDTYYLASQHHQVTYFEVSKPCAEFAQGIFADGEFSVEVLTDPKSLDGRRFDTIICLDVLEHVPDPPGLVQWLGSLLNSDGRLVASAPFFLVNSTAATHLHCNRRFSGDYRRLYEPAGLTPVDGRLFWDPIILQKRESRRIPWKLNAGSALLSLGRFWGLPFDTASNMIRKNKHPLEFK